MESSGEVLSSLGRALSCRIRLEVLQALTTGAASVGELVRTTGTTQPNMSNHLAVLRAAGLVDFRRDGRTVRYELASPAAADLARLIGVLADPTRAGAAD